jgi:hypothetical protein
MSGWEERDAMVRFPVAVADNTETAVGFQRIAVTGAAQTFALPKGWLGKAINFSFRANGTALLYGQVALAPTAQSLVLNQASNAAAGTGSAAAGKTLYDGEDLDRFPIGDTHTHLCWIGNAAAGYAEFYLSERTRAQ